MPRSERIGQAVRRAAALHPGPGYVARWTCAFDARGGADRPGRGEIRRHARHAGAARLGGAGAARRGAHAYRGALCRGRKQVGKSRDFSFTRPRRQRASPPGATKTGTFHSDGRGDGARLHWGHPKHFLLPLLLLLLLLLPLATSQDPTQSQKRRFIKVRRMT